MLKNLVDKGHEKALIWLRFIKISITALYLDWLAFSYFLVIQALLFG